MIAATKIRQIHTIGVVFRLHQIGQGETGRIDTHFWHSGSFPNLVCGRVCMFVP